MRIADWNDYELIDTGSGERLERWGDILLIRPDPQIIWKSDKKDPRWKNAHARYRRSNTGGGRWEAYLLGVLLKPRFGGAVSADEIGLPVTATGLALPCGSTAIWSEGE